MPEMSTDFKVQKGQNIRFWPNIRWNRMIPGSKCGHQPPETV